MKKYQLFTSIVFLALTFSCSAQNKKEKKLTEFIEKSLKQFPVIPGVSIAVTNKDGTVFTQGFGFADKEEKIQATSETNFYIASCTKSFNGLLATILADENKIDLQEQITNYKPFSQFKDKILFQNITVMDLLSHQNGIDNRYLSIKLAYAGNYTRDQIINLIQNKTRPNEDGKAFDYTNFGYYLLDQILYAELGKKWQDLLKEKVFDPIGMKNATAYMSEAEDGKLAFPYIGLYPEKTFKPYLMKTDETMHAAGGLLCNAQDASKFLEFYINNGIVNNKTVYKKELVKDTYKVKVNNAGHKGVKIFNGTGYGTGWRTGEFREDKVVYHFGGYTGFFSHFSFLPKKKIGVAVFVNHELGMPLGNLIAEYAYDLYLGNESNLKKHEKTLKKEFPKMLKKYQKNIGKHRKELTERKWLLSLDKEKYAGTFQNETLGIVKVIYENDELTVKYGNLKAVATPYTKDEFIRLELIPNSGTVLKFNIENNEVKSLSYMADDFKKISTDISVK